MPFVNVRLYEGHGKERKDELAKRVTEAVTRSARSRARRCGSSSRTSPRPTGSGRDAGPARQEVSHHFEKLGTGFLFTEGPVWHPAGQFLLFSDMPGDHLRRWSAPEGVTTFRKPCNKSNGLTYDRQGRLLTCEHATSQVSRTEPDGRIVPIATHHDGKQLNSPNDIVCRSDGSIYFSDPPYGRAKFYGVERAQELSFQGVYRVAPIRGAPISWWTTSIGPTACASPSTSAACSSTTPRASTSASSM